MPDYTNLPKLLRFKVESEKAGWRDGTINADLGRSLGERN